MLSRQRGQSELRSKPRRELLRLADDELKDEHTFHCGNNNGVKRKHTIVTEKSQ
jgi:hypothetical protein